jgi:hypothetical protein
MPVIYMESYILHLRPQCSTCVVFSEDGTERVTDSAEDDNSIKFFVVTVLQQQPDG